MGRVEVVTLNAPVVFLPPSMAQSPEACQEVLAALNYLGCLPPQGRARELWVSQLCWPRSIPMDVSLSWAALAIMGWLIHRGRAHSFWMALLIGPRSFFLGISLHWAALLLPGYLTV